MSTVIEPHCLSAVAPLRDLQRNRRFFIKSCTRQTNATLALIRNTFGFWVGDDEKTRAKAVAASQRIYKAILKGEPMEDPEDERKAEVCRVAVFAAKAGMEGIEGSRAACEAQMAKLAETLPCQDFVARTPGFSHMRLAVIVGEVGDLGDFASPAKLWKMFGVAPDSEYEMETKAGKTAIAKPRRRRSELWVIGDCLIKGNGEGVYRECYLRRKEYESPRVKTKLHAHRRAQRYMEKRLLHDLWLAWNRETGQQDTDAAWGSY